MKFSHDRRPGIAFTLIELMVVVGIIAILSGLIIPALIKARDFARRVGEPPPASTVPVPAAEPTNLPDGVRPIIETLGLKMKLASSYHRIGTDVYTRNRVDCSGRVTFMNPDGGSGTQVRLVVPFPENVVEARDVQLRILDGEVEIPGRYDVAYNRKGIFCSVPMEANQALTAEVTFTAFGRERFEYTLPPARQLRAVDITLDLVGARTRMIPDSSLQPTEILPDQLRWAFTNLVSDRRIVVLVPAAQAPLARVLALMKLTALAVLLFAAGFWFLSEQIKPGQLDNFRLGQLLLLALTYSLYFVIFAVLEFHGQTGTGWAMLISALFSMPLLVLHVSRVFNFHFAVTRVLPLTFFTLGLVINGVYGEGTRDYVFIGAIIAVMAYVTVSYRSWADGREKYDRATKANYTARRRNLIEQLVNGLGTRMAELCAADSQAGQNAKDYREPALTAARLRLERSRQPVQGLTKDYEDIMKRLMAALPLEPTFGTEESYANAERDVIAFQDRVEAHLSQLRNELEHYHRTIKEVFHTGDERIHCMGCGESVPNTPFCQSCGAPHPAPITCPKCQHALHVPFHLTGAISTTSELHCGRCGFQIPLPTSVPAKRLAPQLATES